jgi:cysteine-rich repeat protein
MVLRLLLSSIAVVAVCGCVHDRATLVSDGGATGEGGEPGTGGALTGGEGGMGGTSVTTGAGGEGGAGGSRPGCGDGVLDPVSEQCDDGNVAPQDGCDADCEVECAAGWLDTATNHCYRLIASSATWHDARDGCTSLSPGYDLAAISSDVELAFVVSQLPTPPSSTRFWIGANDLQVEGTFTWSNGEPWGFTAWATDEPNDTNMNEDCGEMRTYTTEWLWNDLACDSTTPTAFLCELTPAGSG